MHKPILISAIVAFASASQPLPAKPVPAAPAIRLTAAEGPITGAGCTLAMDRRLNQVVGGMDYEDGKWQLGINGVVYRFPHSTMSGQTNVMVTANRPVRVEIRTIRMLEDHGNDDVPSGLALVAVAITMRNTQRTINAYHFCMDG